MPVDEIIKKILVIIKNCLPENNKIVLFGSHAKGDALATSDIDIGIIGEEKVKWETMINIKQEVEQIPTLRSIDIVDLNAKNEYFRNKVLSYAKYLN